MNTQVKRYTVVNGDVRLAVTEAGQGQTLVFFNGGGATQKSWKKIIRALSGHYRLVTFDFRNHGESTAVRDTSFAHFQSDAVAVMDKVVGNWERPIVVGWSLGSDLAVWYAAAHPGRVAGLYLIDGAAPVNLVTDPDELLRQLQTPAVRYGPYLLSLVGMGYRLTPEQYAALTIDLNARREHLLAAYSELDCPVELTLATKSLGDKGVNAERKNAAWRAGGERLAQQFPNVSVHWLEGNHLLPLRQPEVLAQALDAFAQRMQAAQAGVHV